LQASATPEPGLFIQVGAFSSRQNASQLSSKLAHSLGEKIRIQEAGPPGKTIFRVQIGPLASVEQVDSLSLNLPKLGIIETHIIID
ncbi:MAG: SPOR domain-containing protein, partial [Sedimenticola sp.]|nr:SPOR domain-containing protein [Sedimenticola sp.]